MAGIYIHVPYCKTRCIYCDFFTQTNQASQLDYVSAVCKEIELRKKYIKDEIVRTIYFGGGTPSLLLESDFQQIFDTIYSTFQVAEGAEITLEANPDDLTSEYLDRLNKFPFNRISIGIQSFDDEELRFINRRHSSNDAMDAVKRTQLSGFKNISIDLMYGLPNQSLKTWKKNLEIAISLDVQHISSYHLIYEEGTKLYRLFRKGEVAEAPEDLSLEMFSSMIDELERAGYEHYEISNFAKKGLYSRHNTSYWQGVKYLGIGPAAHSFDGRDRALNIASIPKYIAGIEDGLPKIEVETLNISSRYNDFILTGLRTVWGVDLKELEKQFGSQYLDFCLKNAQKYLSFSDVLIDDSRLKLTRKGIFISDGIMSDLMWV